MTARAVAYYRVSSGSQALGVSRLVLGSSPVFRIGHTFKSTHLKTSLVQVSSIVFDLRATRRTPSDSNKSLQQFALPGNS